jgi:hypothetical protein
MKVDEENSFLAFRVTYGKIIDKKQKKALIEEIL